MKPKRNTFTYAIFLWITFISLDENPAVHGAECGCHSATFEAKHFIFCPCKKTRSEAVDHCSSNLPGGELATIQDPDTQEFLASELKRFSFGDTWVGATNIRSGWHWVSEKTQLLSQGCYNLDSTQHDITKEVIVNDLTPEKCIESCLLFGGRYAGLKEGSRCFCGQLLERPEFTENCDSPCIGDPSQICGGESDYNLYNLNGSFTGRMGRSSVGPLQPLDTAECIQLTCDYMPEGEVWSWVPSACKKKNHHLCMQQAYDSTSCEGPTKFKINDTCILVEELTNTNWFAARWQCIENGGDLLDFPDRVFAEAVQGSLQCWQSPLWLGATRTTWKWNSEDTVQYSAWAVQNPSGLPERCVAMSITLSPDYEWTDLDCNQFQSFICEQKDEPTTSPPPTTTTVTTTTTRISSSRGSPGHSSGAAGSTTSPAREGETSKTGTTPHPKNTTLALPVGTNRLANWKWVYVGVGVLGALCVLLGVGVYVIEKTKLGRDRCAGIRRCNCLRTSHKYEEDLSNGSIKGNHQDTGGQEKQNGHIGNTNVVLNMHKTNHDTLPNGHYNKT